MLKTVLASTEDATTQFDSQQVIWFDDVPEEEFWKLDPNEDKNELYVDQNGQYVQDPYNETGKYLKKGAYYEYLWTRGLPIGNARMGAIVVGSIDKEVLQINEGTVWTGAPYVDSYQNPTGGSTKDAWKIYRGENADGSPADIGTVEHSISYRALHIDNSSTSEAIQERYSLDKQVEKAFLGTPSRQKSYQSFVEVYLDFGQTSNEVSHYRRRLDLSQAVATVEYNCNGISYKRENIASFVDQAIVTHLTASGNGNLNFTATLHTFHNEDAKWIKVSNNQIAMTSKPSGSENLIKFEARLMIKALGSNIEIGEDNKTIRISGANEATIYVVGATNYVDYLTLDDSKPTIDCNNYIEGLIGKSYAQIKADHIADYQTLYNRSSLNLDNSTSTTYGNMPTPKRVRPEGFTIGSDEAAGSTYNKGGDNKLAVLEFNLGKYLMISGSRPGSQPLTLQGVWNATNKPAWSSKYTININTQMNYWLAQVLNLSECEQPLLDTFDDLARSGMITAKEHYGITGNGAWVMHHNFDLWRGTQPIDNATAGVWPVGGAWLLNHAWQAYLFNKDKTLLAKYYPYMKGACEFFNKALVEDQQTGYLIIAASVSPEQGGIQPGPAMDTQLIRNLYQFTLEASKILDKTSEDAELLETIREKLSKVAPNLIDAKGYIQEWARGNVISLSRDPSEVPEFTVIDPYTNQTVGIKVKSATNNSKHKHCSHLWELFPGTAQSPYNNSTEKQQIFNAYKNTVIARGSDNISGWGLAWRINLRARIADANGANDVLKQLLTTRTSPNMFDQHPTFQIDGNFGAASGIAEMLLQSHDGAITVLPALPQQWSSGEYKGFKARGNFEVDVKWQHCIPTQVKIYSNKGGIVKVRNPYSATAVIKDDAEQIIEVTKEENGTVLVFNSEAGKAYSITGYQSC